MRFRDAITLNTCPLLLRVMLAATFLWFGLPKFSRTDFTGSDAATLAELGIGRKTIVGGTPADPPQKEAKPPEAPAPVNPPAENPAQPPAESQESPDSDQPAAGAPSSEEPQPESGEPEDQPAESASVAQETDAKAGASIGVEVNARRVEGLTIMLHNVGHPYPQVFAWLAMTTEIVGGALLFVGLFSRVWGLGLAVAMGYAFYFTVLPEIHGAADPTAGNPLTSFLSGLQSVDFGVQKSAFFQLSLFVAAWCVFIGGPGAASLDRLIFGGGSSSDD